MERITVQAGEHSSSYQVYDFGDSGPQLCITAGVHGNEDSGIYVANLLVDYIRKNPLKAGRLRIIPLVNQGAFLAQQRRSPADNLDLNRIFPGDPEGSLSEQLAASVYEKTEQATMLVDLHCCGSQFLPYSLSLHRGDAGARMLVRRLNLPQAIQSQGSPGQLFVEAGQRRGQAACIIELPSGIGPGGINLEASRLCFDALVNLLRGLDMLPGAVLPPQALLLGPLLDQEVEGPGLWLPALHLGQWVKQGQLAGEVDGQPVHCPQDALIMGLRPASHLGQKLSWLFTYAVAEQQPKCGHPVV